MLINEEIINFIDVTYLTALRLTGNSEMAKDHTQEAFVKVIKANPERLTAGYMVVAVTNIIRNHWRDTNLTESIDPENILKSVPGHENSVIVSMELEYIKQGLTAEQWKIANMMANKYTAEEIGKELGHSASTINNKVRTMRKKVKKMY